MSIKKPLRLGLIMGLLAMAFAAVPAMASAHALTSPAGTLVPVGTTITATSTNATTVLTGAGTLKCTKSVVNGIVKKNSSGEVEVEMDKENDTATGCTLEGVETKVSVTFTSIILNSKETKATFDFKSGSVEEECSPTVTYTPPATKVHLAGPCTGTLAGAFSGDFTAVVASTGKGVIFD
jgi:hypothetical protein